MLLAEVLAGNKRTHTHTHAWTQRRRLRRLAIVAACFAMTASGANKRTSRTAVLCALALTTGSVPSAQAFGLRVPRTTTTWAGGPQTVAEVSRRFAWSVGSRYIGLGIEIRLKWLRDYVVLLIVQTNCTTPTPKFAPGQQHGHWPLEKAGSRNLHENPCSLLVFSSPSVIFFSSFPCLALPCLAERKKAEES